MAISCGHVPIKVLENINVIYKICHTLCVYLYDIKNVKYLSVYVRVLLDSQLIINP